MSRFLFVVPPLVGHINPLLGVAAELTARGHRVAWAGYADQLERLVGPDAEVFACGMPDGGLVRPPQLAGPAAFKFLWEEFFLPLADLMAPGVTAALHAFAPDIVVADQHAVAGALVAERCGVPYVTSATTSAELIDPLGGMPKVGAWLQGLLTALRKRIGDPSATGDPRFSPHAIIAFTGRALLGDTELPHERTYLVGPAIAPRADDPDFPWHALHLDRKKVLVSLGTANADAGARFLAEAVGALAAFGDRVQGIVVDPGGVIAEVPPGVLVRRYVPQLELLPLLDAVVCHGGHNTVCESLWHGVPLVIAPIRDDQPIVAGQVVDAGAGLRVRFTRVDAARLGAAIESVLDPSGGHSEAARAISKSFRAAGGMTKAADQLASIAAQAGTVAGPTGAVSVGRETGVAK